MGSMPGPSIGPPPPGGPSHSSASSSSVGSGAPANGRYTGAFAAAAPTTTSGQATPAYRTNVPPASLNRQRSSSSRRGKPAKDNRIDPRQIPRPALPAKVGVDLFRTRTAKKCLPPEPCAEFSVDDQGNASPRLVRMTLNQIPKSRDVFRASRLPLCAMVSPFGEILPGDAPVPQVNFGEAGPPRCERCNAFMNVYATFHDDGTTWLCNLCQKSNEVPMYYRCGLDAYGRRFDLDDHPELCQGAVDYIVPSKYTVRPPQDPLFICVVDVSYAAMEAGLTQHTVSSITRALDDCFTASGGRARVGLIAYDSALHFFNLRCNPETPGSEVPVCTAPDVDDPFAALPPEAWLVQIAEQSMREKLLALLDSLPSRFAPDNQELVHRRRTSSQLGDGNSAAGAALAAAVDALQVQGGHVLLFQSCIAARGAGKLRSRENGSHYGTENERLMFQPADGDTFYSDLAATCDKHQVSVDMFLCGSMNLDIATISQVSTATGGRVSYYPGFFGGSSADVQQLQADVLHSLTATRAYEAVMKVRSSRGLAVDVMLGPGSPGSEVEVRNFSLLREDTTLAVVFKYTSDLPEDQSDAFVQLSILYTDRQARRVVRCLNFALPVVSQLSGVFRYADVHAVCNTLYRQAVVDMRTKPMEQIREELESRCVDILYTYRHHCATSHSSGQLILPESLKFLPLFMNSMRRSVVMRGNAPVGSSVNGGAVSLHVGADARAHMHHRVLCMPVGLSIPFIYPRLLVLHDMAPKCGTFAAGEDAATDAAVQDSSKRRVILPPYQWPSSEFLSEDGIVLLDAGIEIFLWIGERAQPELVQSLFGVPALPYDTAELRTLHLQRQSNSFSNRVMNIIEDHLRRHHTPRCHSVVRVVKQGSSIEDHFLELLVEDKGPSGMSYVEALCDVHRKIQNKMNSGI